MTNKSLDMVEDAIVALEDDAYLNAGRVFFFSAYIIPIKTILNRQDMVPTLQ
jgi:hypothetical protein